MEKIPNIIMPVLLAFCLVQGCAQKITPRLDAAGVDQAVSGKRFMFVAQTAYPARGSSRFLTGSYDITVRGDTLVSFLPYFGNSTTAPMNTDEAGVRFTSYQWNYSANKVKSVWEVTINIADQPNTNRFMLRIQPDASATLDVLSKFRDAISFRGYIRSVP